MKIKATYNEMTRDLDSVKTNISSSNLLQKACICPVLEKYDCYIVYMINYQLKELSKETRKNRERRWKEFNELCKNKGTTPEMRLNDAKSFYGELMKNIKSIGESSYNDFNNELTDSIKELANPVIFKKRASRFLGKIFFIIAGSFIGLASTLEHIIK